jgi:hypothetical protein
MSVIGKVQFRVVSVLVVNPNLVYCNRTRALRRQRPRGAVMSVALRWLVDGPQPLRSKQSHPVFVTTMSMPQDTAPRAFLCRNSLL